MYPSMFTGQNMCNCSLFFKAMLRIIVIISSNIYDNFCFKLWVSNFLSEISQLHRGYLYLENFTKGSYMI